MKPLFTCLDWYQKYLYPRPELKESLSSDLRIFSRSFWKDYTRWAQSFIQMKKGNTFTSLFPQSLPAKQSPHVCWQLKIGLSAWGNAQAQSHYQTKLSSDVEPVYFWGVRKRGVSSLCNWRLGRRVGAQRLGDYGKMSLSWTFSFLISHSAIFFYYITQFSLNVFPRPRSFFELLSIEDAKRCSLLFRYRSPALHSPVKHANTSASADMSFLCLSLRECVV